MTATMRMVKNTFCNFVFGIKNLLSCWQTTLHLKCVLFVSIPGECTFPIIIYQFYSGFLFKMINTNTFHSPISASAFTMTGILLCFLSAVLSYHEKIFFVRIFFKFSKSRRDIFWIRKPLRIFNNYSLL